MTADSVLDNEIGDAGFRCGMKRTNARVAIAFRNPASLARD